MNFIIFKLWVLHLTPPRSMSHPSQFYVLLHTDSNLCCPDTHGCAANHWTVTLEKIDSPSHQLSVVPQLGVGTHKSLPPPCWMLIGLILLRSYAGSRCCSEFRTVVVLCRPEDTVFTPVLPHLWLLASSCLSFQAAPRALGDERSTLLWLSTLQKLFSAL